MKHIIYTLCIISLLCAGQTAAALTIGSDATCVDLSHDLSQGSNDITTKKEVSNLQEFLKKNGYLSATPNGNFGSATLSAVKKLQIAYGITPTGTVGPITRLALKIKTCTETTTVSAPTTPTTPILILDVTVPKKDDVLKLGSTQKISWKTSGDNQALILEDEQGVSRGFIVSSVWNKTSYDWKVGEVFSSKSNSTERVKPGLYRIKIEDRNPGPAKPVQISGFFTIEAPVIKVISVLPSSVQVGVKNTVVIYGAGLFRASAYFDDRYYSEGSTEVLYSSPDGNVLVISTPAALSEGSHTLIVKGEYGTSVTSGTIQFVR